MVSGLKVLKKLSKNTWMELGQELLYHEEGLLISFFIVIKNKD